ncbi:unnamed protein product [Tetraodon nigroviridis]|uniref:(spotted green pufferfish) hypothetical protein n=1 Tax=Tetraodon nigroviridis TaxID=99883 RepID=Q4T1R6_TETNG|nr:unnamed protein product [Tetraodon nigroviridis]
MDWTRALVVLLVLIQPCLAVSLTVEAEQNWYWSEFGGDVVMGCRFQAGVPPSNLTVTWHWISSTSIREAYRLENGLEHPDTQDPVYRDRATLLREELKDGWAKLKISELRIGDSGTYQCLVRAGIEADYKEIHLTVRAPYKTVTKHLQRVEGGDEALLTCQSEGLPKSSVQWLDGHGRPLNASTTATVTPQQLIRVTSRIQVRFHDDSNYTCSFDGGVSATFVLRGDCSLLLLLTPRPPSSRWAWSWGRSWSWRCSCGSGGGKANDSRRKATKSNGFTGARRRTLRGRCGALRTQAPRSGFACTDSPRTRSRRGCGTVGASRSGSRRCFQVDGGGAEGSAGPVRRGSAAAGRLQGGPAGLRPVPAPLPAGALRLQGPDHGLSGAVLHAEGRMRGRSRAAAGLPQLTPDL